MRPASHQPAEARVYTRTATKEAGPPRNRTRRSCRSLPHQPSAVRDSAKTSSHAFLGSTTDRCAHDCREETASIAEAA